MENYYKHPSRDLYYIVASPISLSLHKKSENSIVINIVQNVTALNKLIKRKEAIELTEAEFYENFLHISAKAVRDYIQHKLQQRYFLSQDETGTYAIHVINEFIQYRTCKHTGITVLEELYVPKDALSVNKEYYYKRLKSWRIINRHIV